MEEKELDLTLAKAAQEHYIEAQENINMNQNENFFKKSFSNEKIRINGEVYVGKHIDKERVKKTVKIASGFLLAVVLMKGVSTINLMDRYYHTLDSKAQKELTQEEFENYQHDKPSFIEAYRDYQDAKNELKQTGNYSLLGKNLNSSDQSSYEETDFLSFTNIQEDAMKQAISEQIRKY